MQKRTLLFICLLSLANILIAQKEGEILFKETMKIEITVPEGSPITAEELKKMMPGEQVFQRVLYFNEDATLYTSPKNAEAEDDTHEINSEDGGIQIRMKMVGSGGENQTYVNLKKESLTERREFMGKTFIIQDEDPKLPWKLGTDQKEILGYNCTNATATIEDREVEAWFTTELPLASGPGNYYGLPGMILEVSSKGERGSRKIQATAINEKPLEKDLIQAPKKGKKVTSDEFRKIVEEKTKEMQEQMGGGGNRIIIRG
jgi:GLPGLI family protein